jgi:hypothetical protein
MLETILSIYNNYQFPINIFAACGAGIGFAYLYIKNRKKK